MLPPWSVDETRPLEILVLSRMRCIMLIATSTEVYHLLATILIILMILDV